MQRSKNQLNQSPPEQPALPKPELSKAAPRAVLAGISFRSREYAEVGFSMDELAALARTAGLRTLAKVTQVRERPSAGSMFGSGKVREIRDRIVEVCAQALVLNVDMPYGRKRTLADKVGARVIDRTELILKIFAQRATTAEGRLQIKMAELSYHLQRLVKEQKYLDRQGAGIGTRGPGESAPEMARRRIFQRKKELSQKLETLKRQRETRRARRKDAGVPRIGLAGYTNAGKSTLLNALARTSVGVADQLFTTLQTTTRRVRLPSRREALLTDTVGFIRGLPHHLVDAFEATLREAADADLILEVLDASHPDVTTHHDVVTEVLGRLGAESVPRLVVLNKVDRLSSREVWAAPVLWPGAAVVSARTGQGLDRLLGAIEDNLYEGSEEVKILVPYDRMEVTDMIYRLGEVVEQAYLAEGAELTVALPRVHRARFRSLVEALR
ncbi:GTPase HflX [Planctomycetota bacterium]